MSRLAGALVAAVMLVLASPGLTGAASGGADHHIFNPSAHIDSTQIEVRP